MNAPFSSRFASELPADPDDSNQVRQVFSACYSRVAPTPVTSPSLVAYSREMVELLGYSDEEVNSHEFADIFAGNRLAPGMIPYAACYGGHQFGSWAGQLGDGRAIGLGERVGKDGKLWELQLKGAGPTPYSRRADGRAVMRSSVREFLCSEAMHHLGVPTTRALCLVSTGDEVVRDMLYDGHPRKEPGAVVCRVSPSFLRFGNFEIFASRQDLGTLRALTSFTLRHFFPHLLGPEALAGQADPNPEEIARFFDEVCQTTAKMVVEWLRVGFVHGVMNTDNMSILGLTIDYGPYGFLDDFDPTWTPNTTDAHGRRYRFGQQPRVAEWNLLQLGNSLLPLVERPEPLEDALRGFSRAVHEHETRMMSDKLGLRHLKTDGQDGEDRLPEDRQLIEDLMVMLTLVETDMTLFYRNLARLEISSEALKSADLDVLRAPLDEAYYDPTSLTPEVKKHIDGWLRAYIARALRDERPDGERARQMNSANPRYVFRNYLAQLAIDRAEQGDGSLVMEMLDTFRRPYDDQPGREQFAGKRPEWARSRPGCSMLSCSS